MTAKSMFRAAALLLVLPASAVGQVVAGRVFDGVSAQPVAGAEVAVLDAEGHPIGLALSDSVGGFAIQLEAPGSYGIAVMATGYDRLQVDSLAVEPEQVVTVELRLGPRPLAVEGLTVVARRAMGPPALRRFYDRLERQRQTGAGVVLDRQDLDEFPGLSGAGALARESMVLREYSTYGGGEVELRRLSRRLGLARWCKPALFLDGLEVDATTIRSLPASTLAGLELYRGPSQVPGEFAWADGAADCGVVAAWTRRDGSGPLVAGEMRPFRVGGFTAAARGDAPGGSRVIAAVGLELERGLARSMAGWIQVGLTRPALGTLCVPGVADGCGDGGTPWMVIVGASLFPTGSQLPIAPYVGGGVGLASPGSGMETTHLVRAGIELVPGPAHVRVELRQDPNGWGVGVGVMF